MRWSWSETATACAHGADSTAHAHERAMSVRTARAYASLNFYTRAMVESGVPERRWLALVAMTGSLSMIMLDSTILGVALPTISRDLSMDATTQAWAVNAYLVAMASFVALGGRAGDRIGRMRAFRLGIVGFALSSIACAMSTSAWAFVAARAAQGLSAALMQPASAAIVIDLYPPERRGRAMATYAGISLLFLAAGPLVGGVLLSYQSWHLCFWLNVPVAVLALALSMSVRHGAHDRRSRALDWPSVVMLAIGMPLFVSGLQAVRADAAMSARALSTVLPGLALLWLFVRRQLTIASPLVDLAPLRDRALLASACTLFAFQFINVGQGIYGSWFLQASLHFSPMEAGLATLPMMVPVLAIVHWAGKLYDTSGPRRPVVCGLSLTVLGAVVESVGVAWLSYPVMAIGMACIGTGCGLAMSPSNTDALARAKEHQRGEVSGIIQSFRLAGGTLGVALIVLVMQLVSPTDSAWTPRAVSAGFALHAVVALGALALAFAFVRSRAPRYDGSTATT